MNLAEFQALFQNRILEGAGKGDTPLLNELRPSQRGAERETLLGVYQRGYRARLGEFLREDHPGLRVLIGDDAFDTLTDEYIAANPPRNRNARWYTTGLPDFMRESPRWRGNRLAVSMALFERAMVDAFDAADAEPLTIETLAQFAPEDWPRLAFGFHPSLIVLELAAGTLEAYDPSPDDEDARALDQDGVEAAAVWRVNEESAYRGLDPDEYVALNEAREGRAFGDICQMAAFQQSGEIEPERLAQFLASWFEDGMIVSARPQNDD